MQKAMKSSPAANAIERGLGPLEALPPCNGECTGYKTQPTCPPLIVMALRTVSGELSCCDTTA